MNTLSTLMEATPLVGQLLSVRQSDPGTAMTAARRLSHFSRRWGLVGTVAGALATLAFGEVGRDIVLVAHQLLQVDG